ncbi:MAG TPA: ABC-type transport auxiliary lipoprotein family protein [Beijerinckiaceae bacterium]|nr:membrane integrity-associated transporter subunit PqiC [Methylobacteriaceae bacterium]MCC0002272.1 membrane integrity-associated transporter subunit PqiC [Methylobacteriaceae bacterium]MCO5086147.1 ABC-type transport auxiliary lipoprotein family protein [Methylobacteriaceae bacterium]HRY02869.1 ABC-type transport auxiliary lipoprotein family protein [Beijerinckiaceae bacterium]
MRPFRRCFLTLATIAAPALLLAGCGGSQLASFDLAAAPMGKMRAGAIRGVLAVAEPVADGPLDSERIVIRTGPDQLAYLSGAKWAGNLPSLLQSKIIASFENAHLVKSVVRPGGVSDYSLHVDIRRFEVDVVDNIARIELSARIVSDGAGRPVAARIFSATTPADRTADGKAAQALDATLANVLRQMVTWTARAI